RTLILRVLVAAGRSTDGVAGEDVIEFLENSFGVFQIQQAGGGWNWNRHDFEQSLDDLARNGFVERREDGKLAITSLGRLAGESALEVESLIRIVECLRSLRADDISDPALVTIVQLSVELDEVYFPLNKKSTQKEPQHWVGELSRQGVSRQIVASLHRNISDATQPTARAKKAIACLYYVSGLGMDDIERAVGQFGGAFDGAAGPIRAVATRT